MFYFDDLVNLVQITELETRQFSKCAYHGTLSIQIAKFKFHQSYLLHVYIW